MRAARSRTTNWYTSPASNVMKSSHARSIRAWLHRAFQAASSMTGSLDLSWSGVKGGTRLGARTRDRASPTKDEGAPRVGMRIPSAAQAGAEGFEPPVHGFKVRCLTAWPRPSDWVSVLTPAAIIPSVPVVATFLPGGVFESAAPGKVLADFSLPSRQNMIEYDRLSNETLEHWGLV